MELEPYADCQLSSRRGLHGYSRCVYAHIQCTVYLCVCTWVCCILCMSSYFTNKVWKGFWHLICWFFFYISRDVYFGLLSVLWVFYYVVCVCFIVMLGITAEFFCNFYFDCMNLNVAHVPDFLPGVSLWWTEWKSISGMLLIGQSYSTDLVTFTVAMICSTVCRKTQFSGAVH